MRRLWTVLLTFPLVACPGADDPVTADEGDDSSSDTGDSGSDTGGDAGLCACIPEQNPGPPKLPTCESNSCGTVSAASSSSGSTDTGGPSFILDNPEALQCALEALRDRTPTIVRWELSVDGGFSVYDGYLLVGADGLVVERTQQQVDLGGQVSDAVLTSLIAPDALQACIDDPDDEARFDCLRNATQGEAMEICEEGW